MSYAGFYRLWVHSHFTLLYEVDEVPDPDFKLLPILRVYCPCFRGSMTAAGGLAILSPVSCNTEQLWKMKVRGQYAKGVSELADAEDYKVQTG